MIALFKKELFSLIGNFTAFMIMGLYLLLSALFLWIFEGNFNIFENGYSSLSSFFRLSPWLFIFLIPALCMGMISEEKSQGTLEVLETKPLSLVGIIVSKFSVSALILLLMLCFSSISIFSIYELSLPVGNLDFGTMFMGYIGLFLLGLSFISLSLLASSFTSNIILSFLLALFLCFFFYFGFSGLASYNLLGNQDYWVQQIGLEYHYQNFLKGILDSRSLFYFLFIIGFSSWFTLYNLENNKV